MSITINSKDRENHIETILSLLKKQNYTSQTTILTTSERKKLYDFLYLYDECGDWDCVFGEYYNLTTQEDVDKFNEKVFENMDEEIREIITKCDIDTKKLFFIDKNFCDINKQLILSMQAYSTANVGDYTIEFIRDHPIDIDSDEIKAFHEDVQKEKVDKYKDGEASFKVSAKTNFGEEVECYYHSEEMHAGGYVSFMGEQIGGNFGINEFRFSNSSGIILGYEGSKISESELMTFFKYFESLLSFEIINIIDDEETSVSSPNNDEDMILNMQNKNKGKRK